MALEANPWHGRRVLITGITGFKGGWLALWLRELGATVVGYSLPPPTTPSLFEIGRVRECVEWTRGDVRDRAELKRVVARAEPEIVFHLAAQPLVRASYDDPVETFEVNLLGTVNVLDSLRECTATRAVVVVTTDKCYENQEWCWPYRETDPLGGRDPYSSSKACAEIATSTYYRSFYETRGVGIATARAGNVLGGGDWARDRLLPDCLAALERGESISVRNPRSVRPWQHVLDPLSGYIRLAERLLDEPTVASGAWNFGPNSNELNTVLDLVRAVCALWGSDARWHSANLPAPHEAGILALDASKARDRLGWRPCLTLRDSLAWTVSWHQALRAGEDMRAYSLRQIHQYERLHA